MLIPASTVNKIMILKLLLRQTLIICDENMAVSDPNVLINPNPMILT